MEKLSDFFSELKERISNPFILSYLIGWCIWNYEIPVGLIFYKSGELKVDGYKSYFDLIQKHSSTWHFFWLPLFSAIVYTFLFPFIKNLISAFGAWINTWGSNWNLNISKTLKVSSEKYLEYKIQYEEALEKISNYVNDEQSINDKLTAAQNEKNVYEDRLKALDNQLKASQSELQLWQLANSNNFLDGEWYLKTTTTKTENSGRQTADVVEFDVVISGGAITMTKGDQTTTTLYITNIICNFIYLIIYLNSQRGNVSDGKSYYWSLAITNKNIKILRGSDSQGAVIELRNKVLIIPPN